MSIKNGHIAIDFIDPLFATVISLNFAQLVTQPWFNGLYLLPYFQQPWTLWNNHSKLQLAGWLLSYVTVVTSWVGYHVSIKNSPIIVQKRSGFLRFIFDIVLLGLYWLLLTTFQSLTFQLYLLVLIFFVFIIWDALKGWEYKATDDINSQRRRGVTTFWFLVFLGIYVLYVTPIAFWASLNMLPLPWRNLSFLGAAGIALILYRLHKTRPWPGVLLDILSFHKPGFYVPSLRIYVAGPYSAVDASKVELNVKKAIDAGVEVFQKGHIPFIPHLTHFVELRTKETGQKMRWEDYIAWDKSWLEKSDALLYLGESPGADMELEYARAKRKKIFTSLTDIPNASKSMAKVT